MVPVVYHPGYRDYNFGPDHPFTPVRLEMLLGLLDALGHPLAPVFPAPATRDDVRTVHSLGLIEQVEAASQGKTRPDARHFGLNTPDVPVFAGMDEATRLLVGGTLHGARMITEGEADKVLQLGGGLHHAQEALASGFCIYNDLSVAISHLRAAGLRVAYIDIDVHHGDGVQWLCYDDPHTMTISLHESGNYLFPGTGGIHELGKNDGRGFKLNVPLEPYTESESYLEAFERVVPHALSWFQPEVLVVQCGADAHFQDPLAHLLLMTPTYERLFRRLLELADQYADGRALFTLGGGYDLDATTRVWTLLCLILQAADLPDALPSPWVKHWQDRLQTELTPTLHDQETAFNVARRTAIEDQNRQASQHLLEMAAPFWY